MLLSLVVMTLIHGVICPNFFALSMLEIIFPFAFVPSTILMNVNSIAVGLIVEPLSLEDIAIYMPEFAVSTGLVKAPVALVLSAIFPNLDAVAVLKVSEPLTHVGCAIFEMDLWSLLQLGLVDLAHVELAVELSVEHVISAHIVVVLGVQFIQLSSDSFSRHHAACPRLQANDQVSVLLKVHQSLFR